MAQDDWLNIINDPPAYEKFYLESFSRFYNYGRKFTVNTSVIEDSIQEVFLDLWTNKEKLSNANSINAYTFSAFRYTLIRKIKQDQQIINDLNVGGEPVFSADIEIISRETDNEMRKKLQAALAGLTAHQREAIFLRFYQGLSYEEISEVLGISVKATYKIMARSLASLRENMPAITYLLLFCLLRAQKN